MTDLAELRRLFTALDDLVDWSETPDASERSKPNHRIVTIESVAFSEDGGEGPYQSYAGTLTIPADVWYAMLDLGKSRVMGKIRDRGIPVYGTGDTVPEEDIVRGVILI